MYKDIGKYRTPAIPHWTADAWKKGRFDTFRTKRDVWEEHKDGMRLIYRLISYSAMYGVASLIPFYFFLKTSTVLWGLLFTLTVTFAVYYYRASAGEYGGLITDEYAPVSMPVNNIFDEGIDYRHYPFTQETPPLKTHYNKEKFGPFQGKFKPKT